jgi:hypothetical protein
MAVPGRCAYSDAMPLPVANLERLRTAGEQLPGEVRRAILAEPSAHEAGLVEILVDADLGLESAPDGGYAPIHAVTLLAEMRATAAIQPMIDQLLDSDWNDILHDRILVSLPRFGAAALEPVLTAFESCDDSDQRHSLCAVLAKLGVRDDRILDALLDVLLEEPSTGAISLAEYGDPAALPALERAIARHEPDFTTLLGTTDLEEIVATYEDLGGVLPEALQAKVEAWRAKADAVRRAVLAPPVQKPKLGRNDPCPCGSGKKFKKCCIDAGSSAAP